MRTILIFFASMLAAAILPVLIIAQESIIPSETLTVEGTGKSEAEAEKAAHRSAIERVLWTIADAKIRENHNSIIQDSIYKNPTTFISKTELLSSKRTAMKTTVIMKVTIKKDQMIEKLQNLKVISKSDPILDLDQKMESGITNSRTTPSSNMEEVVLEGIGKTEASAKKAAYKEAVARVVGVLIDSNTRIKNDKIIDEELLEYSGGFVTKAELLSSKKDDEGLIRVKVRCVVEKAQVRKKLEEIKVLVVKVDGESIRAMQMTQEEMRKNAATLLTKALEERKKIYEAKLPVKLEELEKFANNKIYVPVSIELNAEQYKTWSSNWMPVFEKLAVEKETAAINYTTENGSNRGKTSYASDLSLDSNGWQFLEEQKNKAKSLSNKNACIILVGSRLSDSGVVQYASFRIECHPTDIPLIVWEKTDPATRRNIMNTGQQLFLTLEIMGKDDSLIHSSNSEVFGKLKSQTNSLISDPINKRSRLPFNRVSLVSERKNDDELLQAERLVDTKARPYLPLLMIPPAAGHSINRVYTGESLISKPGNYGCFFEVDSSKLADGQATRMQVKLEWKKGSPNSWGR